MDCLADIAEEIRRKILITAWNGKAGHITSSLSCVEIMTALYFGGILRYRADDVDWEERDRFILSKAHAGLGFFNVLARAGYFEWKKLQNYCKPGSIYGDHTSLSVRGVENSGGSLGHGLAFAAGKAMAARIQNRDYLTYVLTGDGECQEGSIWEAAMFIGNYKLSNVIWIIERNGLQANGFVDESMSLYPLGDKLRSFGFQVREIDGHDFCQLEDSLLLDRVALPEKPMAVIANTVKGKGVPLFEGKGGWHGKTPSKEEYQIIFEKLGITAEELQNYAESF